MSQDEDKKKELEQEVRDFMAHFQKGGSMAPAENTQEWEKMIDASDRTPEQKEQLKELGRFLSLKKYLEDNDELVGPVVLDGFAELHRFPLNMQITWLRNTNRKLMERIGSAGSRA